KPRERDLDGPLGRRLNLPVTSSLDDRTLAAYFLRTDPAPKYHWRWSLVIPQGAERTLGDGELVVSATYESAAFFGTLMHLLLRSERQRLARGIAAAQRLRRPPDAPAEAAFTLDRIESLIDEFRER